ncbi:MAG: lysylphosphatidylglycerol synthase transmembrane domain-containing protein [Mobilitalea sp.]
MNKKKVITILRIGISIALLAVVIKFADIDKVAKSLKNFNQIWLLPIFLLILLSVIVSSYKWNTLIKAQKVSIRITTLFAYYNCGLFFNNFLPSSIGGDGIRIYLAGKKSDNYSAAASSVVMERTIATVTLAFLGLISSIFANKPSRIAINLLAVLFVVGVLLAFVLISGWVPKSLKNREGKISKAWVGFVDSAKELQKRKKELAICFIQSLLFQVIVAMVIGAIMAGLNLPVLKLPDLFLITSASSVLAMVPLGLNGYGMREGAYIYLLSPFGYATSAALTISILFAFFVTIYSLIGGINWLVISKENKTKEKLFKKNVEGFVKSQNN